MIAIPEKFIPSNYRQCSLCVMDNISNDEIQFDVNGVCSYHNEFLSFLSENHLDDQNFKFEKLNYFIKLIKKNGRGKKFDCVLGLSGGIDSTYLAYLAKLHELKPLIVHFDYGWNTDLAIRNIENTTKKLGFELYTYVIDWNIMRDLQRSYFQSSVVDLDVPADHTIFGAIFHVANKMGIKYILSGSNYQSEFIMPKNWNYKKTDLTNLKNIHNKFGEYSFKGIPKNGFIDQVFYRIKGIQSIPLLYYVDYNKNKVTDILKKEVDYIEYEAKHFENIYTRFYQGFILPNKFGIDKRKCHLSSMIMADHLSKNEAINYLNKDTYPDDLQKSDFEFIGKKLGFTEIEFEKIITQPNISHQFYGTDERLRRKIFKIISPFLSKERRIILSNKI